MATKYILTKDEFTAITETSGTIQNVGTEVVELVSTTNETEGEGILLAPHEKRTFNGSLAARGTGDLDAAVNVVDFIEAGKGGGGTLPIATKNTLGGIKVGNGLQIDKNGVLSSTITPDNSVVTWTAGTAYKVGQYVIYNNQMYECKTANDDDEFDEDKWQVVGGSGGVGITDWVAGKKYKADELVIYNNTLYKCITANEDDEFTPAKWQVIGGVGTGIDDWQKNHQYEVGNLVIYDDKIYRCETDHKSGTTFDSEKWTEIGDAGNVQAWESGASYAVDDFAIYDNRLYKCKTANDDDEFDPDNWQDMGAIQHTVEAWESGKSYAVGDLVLKDNVIYKCKTANDDTEFDPDNWTVEIDNDKSVTPWVAGTDYAVGKYVVYDNKIWECKTANDDDTFDEEKWTEISAATGIVLEQWTKNTSYKTNQLVEHDGYAYLCLTAHTSTADFDDDYDDEYWLRMPSYVMTGADDANDGKPGLVPQPKKNDSDKFLCGDGTWKGIGGLYAVTRVLWEGTAAISGQVLNLTDDITNYEYVIVSLSQDESQYQVAASTIMRGREDTSCIVTFTQADTVRSYELMFSQANSATLSVSAGNTGIECSVSRILGLRFYNPNNYSTTEQEIGTWIDGKPLYQKVYTGTTPSSTSIANIISIPEAENFSMCFIKAGYIYKKFTASDDYDWYDINEDGSSNNASRLFVSHKNKAIRGNVGSNFTRCPLVVILNYTY